MTERGILFTAENVRAIIEGRKTQTRRVMKHQSGNFGQSVLECPYGMPGDRLWVKETFLLRSQGKAVVYRAVVEGAHGPGEAAGFGAMYGGWKPCIFMPRWASRLLLEITEVRVERVQDISFGDAKAEGCEVTEPRQFSLFGATKEGRERIYKIHADMAYRPLWDSINAKRDDGIYAWAANPWVWCLTFKRLNA